MVVCVAGSVLGALGACGQSAAGTGAWPGPGVLESWLIMAAEIQLLLKMDLLPAPPLTEHPILVLFPLFATLASTCCPGHHSWTSSVQTDEWCVSQSFDSKHMGRILVQGEWALRGRARFGWSSPAHQLPQQDAVPAEPGRAGKHQAAATLVGAG